jgi:hypothetical protein
LKIENAKPLHCELILRSSAVHLSQIFTGFGLLKESGVINVTLKKSQDYAPNVPQRLKVIVNNKTKIIFDVRDSEAIDRDDLHWSDLYFKRSYSKAHFTDPRIHPLGLNYAAFGKSDFSHKFFWFNLEFLIKNAKEIGSSYKSILRSTPILNKLLHQEIGRGVSDFNIFEGKPKICKKPLILFQFRLWDPNSPECKTTESSEERNYINTMRVNCLIHLRKEFGDQFIGGISPNQFAKSHYPHLLVSEKQAQKAGYIKKFQESSICVTTMGLMGSNGWKLGEYVAGAKAIVCEHPKFEVPGEFGDGKNYFGFSSPEKCVERVTFLINNPEIRYEMMKSNLQYYQLFLRPDRLVWNAISEALYG